MEEYKDTRIYGFLRPIVKIFMYMIFRPKIINKGLIPKTGKVILAGNHTSKLDALLLISSTNRHIHFLAKKELFSGITGILINRLGLISVDREAKDKKNVFINAKKYLNNDKVILIFPEGTTEKESFPNLLSFKIGAVKLSYETNTKIIPFKIIGKYKIFGKRIRIKFENAITVNNDLENSNKELYDIINNIKE